MNVKPKRWADGRLRTVPTEEGHIVMECEVIAPPSAKGRTVYVWLDPEDVTKALLELRDAAIQARR